MDEENIETPFNIEDETIQALMVRTRENVYSCRNVLTEIGSHLSGRPDTPNYDDEEYSCLKDMIVQIERAAATCREFADDIRMTIFGH